MLSTTAQLVAAATPGGTLHPMEDLQLLKIPVGAFAILAFLIAVFWITG
jgi:hypothetical protein